MTQTEHIVEALTRLTNQDRFEAEYADAAQVELDALLARLEAAEAVAEAISQFCAVYPLELSPLGDRVLATLAAWERSQETGQP